MHLIAKVIRISRAKFHCNRLTTVHTIFKIMRVSFFGTHCSFTKFYLQLMMTDFGIVKQTSDGR